MFQTKIVAGASKPDLYRDMTRELQGLMSGERDPIANAANLSALLYTSMPDLNWAGFYFLRSPDELVLGPFQGKPACIRIPVGKGVCGTTVARRHSILVEDVHAFPGHIACDAASRSELVVPLMRGETILGVLDLDSPIPSRFDVEDQAGIEAIARLWVAGSDPL